MKNKKFNPPSNVQLVGKELTNLRNCDFNFLC